MSNIADLFSTIKVLPIKSVDTYNWLLKKHYAKRIPNITNAFGLFEKSNLIGVVTYGIPASPSLCVGVCGKEHSGKVRELNRLCLQDNYKNYSSFLISKSLKMLKKPKIVVSYADTSQGHVGYVYQATNFLYTGISAKRTEWRIKGSNLHSKTITEQSTLEERQKNPQKYETVDRPRKHRYIYIVGSKKDRKTLTKALNYDQLPYPKGDTKQYNSGSKVITQMILEL